MAVRDFKKFFKRKGKFVRQPHNEKETFQRSQDDKNIKNDRKCFRCGDPNHLIRECSKPPKDKNQRISSEVLGAIVVSKMMKMLKTKLVSCLMHLVSEITKDGKVIGRGIRKSGLRLGQANMCLIVSLASKELVRNLPKLKFDQHFCDACKIGKQAHVDDDLDEDGAIKVTEKKNLENDIEDETLKVDKIVNIKESKNHPLDNFIGNLNQRNLRSQAQNQSNFFCFITSIEPKNVNEALKDESWILQADEELSDGGSSRVIVYGYDGLPMLPVDPPSPYYIPGPEEPQTPPAPQDEDEHKLMFIQPHDPDFMPEPIYPEYIPLEDEHILLAEEQPLPLVVSPTAESPRYVAESDLEEDPEEYEEDETKDGPVNYPIDGGDDGDDDDGDSFGYDADDEYEDEEEEEEHLALADSVMTSISLPPEAEVERLLAMPTPSPLPLTSLLPPSTGERLARCMALAALPSPPLPPSLYPPPSVDCRDGIPESEQPPRKRLCLSTLGSMYEVEECSTRGQGIDPAEVVPEMEPTTLEKVNTRVTELAELHEHDSHDLYALLEDAQDVWIMEEDAYAAREAWSYSVRQIIAPLIRQRQNLPPPNTNTPLHHMTPEPVQAMIDQALLRNSTNGDGSQSSHEDNPRHVQTTRPCFYANFMKCHPLNIKGNEGVVGLT
nr:Gag-Pol polyprotein [Tanacetum cinerariifolium]